MLSKLLARDPNKPGNLKLFLAQMATAWGTVTATRIVGEAAERLAELGEQIEAREKELAAYESHITHRRGEVATLERQIADLHAENRRLLDLSPREAEGVDQAPETD